MSTGTEKYREKKKNGICQYCSRKAINGYYCAIHLITAKESRRKTRNKKISKGKCQICCKNINFNRSKRLCTKCLDKKLKLQLRHYSPSREHDIFESRFRNNHMQYLLNGKWLSRQRLHQLGFRLTKDIKV